MAYYQLRLLPFIQLAGEEITRKYEKQDKVNRFDNKDNNEAFFSCRKQTAVNEDNIKDIAVEMPLYGFFNGDESEVYVTQPIHNFFT